MDYLSHLINTNFQTVKSNNKSNLYLHLQVTISTRNSKKHFPNLLLSVLVYQEHYLKIHKHTFFMMDQKNNLSICGFREYF